MRSRLLACAAAFVAAAAWGATITNVEPNHGPTTGGTALTLTGTGLAGVSQVQVGAYPCTNVAVESDTRVTAVTAPGTAGTFTVFARDASGYIFAPDSEKFEYVPPPVIADLDPNPSYSGAILKVTGSYFRSTAKVTFGPPVNVEVTPLTITSSRIDRKSVV